MTTASLYKEDMKSIEETFWQLCEAADHTDSAHAHVPELEPYLLAILELAKIT